MLTGLDNEVDEVADVVIVVLMFCDLFSGLLRLTLLKEGVSSAEAAHQEGEQGRDVRLSVTGEVPEKKSCVLSRKKRLPRERIKSMKRSYSFVDLTIT